MLAGLLFGALQAGGYTMQSRTGTPIDVVLVLQSLIVLLIAAPPLVRAVFLLPGRRRRPKEDTEGRRARGGGGMTTLMDRPASAPGEPEFLAALKPISYKGPIAYGVVGLISLVVFGLLAPSGADTTFTFASNSDWFQIPPITVPSKLTAVLLSIVALGLAGYAFLAARSRRKTGIWVPVVFGIAVVLAFLTWAVAGKDLPLTVTGLLQGSLFLAIPLVFGSLSGLVCERVGIINIAIEGQLLSGAFLGAVVATMAGSPYIGLIAAPIAGALVGLLLAWFAISYRVDQIIVGVVLNVLVIGLTNYLYSTVLTENSGTLNPRRACR